jgi:DNA polymerase III epsilon subunit-like protein
MFRRNRNEYYGSYFMTIPIDTAHIATEYFMNKRKKPENYKLKTLLEFFKIPFLENKLHGALYDVKKTKELYNVLKRK